MTTALQLSTNNSKTKVLLNLKKAHSSEGVPTLNMAGKAEAVKLLYLLLQSHKVQEAKWSIFGPFHGLLAHWREHSSRRVVIPVRQYSGFALVPSCSRGPYTVRGRVWQSVFPLFCIDKDLAEMAKNKSKFVWSRQWDYCAFIAYKILLVVFSYLRALTFVDLFTL